MREDLYASRARFRRLGNARGQYLSQYVFLVALTMFVAVMSVYIPRVVSGGLVDAAGNMLGMPSRDTSGGGSIMNSEYAGSDSETSVGSQFATFSGASSSKWISTSGFSLAVEEPPRHNRDVGETGGAVNTSTNNSGMTLSGQQVATP